MLVTSGLLSGVWVLVVMVWGNAELANRAPTTQPEARHEIQKHCKHCPSLLTRPEFSLYLSYTCSSPNHRSLTVSKPWSQITPLFYVRMKLNSTISANMDNWNKFFLITFGICLTNLQIISNYFFSIQKWALPLFFQETSIIIDLSPKMFIFSRLKKVQPEQLMYT